MAYVLPQVLVFQEFDLVSSASVQDLPAHISGGHAALIRYSDEDEREDGFLGYYNRLLDTAYAWPNRPAGGEVNGPYTKVYIKNALLKYFEDLISAESTIIRTSGYDNRVSSNTVNFKENGDDFPRDADLLDRDVALGDTVKVRAIVGGDVYTLWTYVRGFAGDVVAAVVNAATADSNNSSAQSAPAADSTKTAGVDNCVDVESIDQSSYSGLEEGDINETYTVTVIESSVAGDATTARLRVVSASGNDDVASVTPAAFGSPTDIGTRNLTATWNTTSGACSASASDADVAADDFIAGQQWRFTCGQAFTAPVATSGGTYAGEETTTYIAEVTKGGLYADSPEITISTTTGIDVSGPTIVTAANTFVVAGSQGVTVKFNATGLRRGDKYLIEAEGEGAGANKTLILGHNLDIAIPAGTDVDLTLFIKKDLQIGENRTGFAPLVNWEQGDTEIEIMSGVVAQDATWTDGGVPQYLDVYSEESKEYGRVYVEYRAWLSDLCNEVGSVEDIAAIDDAISGELHPDNPLKWGVFKALQNSNGVPVKFTSVCNPDDSDSWLAVLELIDGRDDVYGLVPLTKNRTVMDAYQAHCEGQSDAETGRWRVAWLNLEGIPDKAIVSAASSEDDGVVLADLADDPLTSGTQYTLLTVPAGNGNFVTNEVIAGDLVRFLYTTDGFGGELYTEFVVDEVINEDEIRLLVGHSAPISTAQKIEIWRDLSATQQATELAIQYGYSDRRVRAVWPDEVGAGGLTFEGYFLCAALAGLSSGVVPHQGLTRLELQGFDDLTRTINLFNRSQLDTMAGGGVWIVTQDPVSGAVFTRHAVTTADYDDINAREEQVVRNVDSISFFFQDAFDPYIGRANVTPSLLSMLRSEIESAIQFLRSNGFVPRLGSQLIDAEITAMRAHATLKDRVLVALDLTIPYALNNIEVHLVV